MIDKPMLTELQLKALEIYIDTGSIKSVCDELQIKRGTFYGWLRTDEWKDAIKAIKENVYDELSERVAISMHIALDTVMRVMRTADPTTFNQLKAAEMILNFVNVLYKQDATNTQSGLVVILPQKDIIDDSNNS